MTFLRVMAISLVALLAFTLFANILPQVQSDPPQEEEIDPETLDRAGQIAWGESLFSGKGTCALCHNNLARAPDLLALDLATVLPARLGDSRYDGAAMAHEGAVAIEVYLRESLLEPSVFVVAGFGKKGTGDTVSPMPNAGGPPISLSETETDAVIAFLQNRAGVTVTVALPSESDQDAAPEPEPEDEMAATAEAAIEKFACAGCHDLAGSGADIGPRLGGLGERMNLALIRQSILDPNAVVAEGFDPDFMPRDYGARMRADELELLVDYLAHMPPDTED